MAQQRSQARRGSRKGGSRRGNNRKDSGSAARAGGAADLDSAHLEGREPSHDPDVFVDIHKVKVDEVYVDVEHLEAHLALRAKLANLLQVVAGVHIHLGKVEVDIKGVEAQARLKVRLENLYDILDRALTTLSGFPSGACRDRTGDLRLAKPALSQLSYRPAVRFQCRGACRRPPEGGC